MMLMRTVIVFAFIIRLQFGETPHHQMQSSIAIIAQQHLH
jgi:hypothetical protein